MNTSHDHPRLRRGFTFVALVATLGLSALTLSQCRLVDDSVTGVDLKSGAGYSTSNANGRSACVHRCEAAYKSCREKEEAQHRAEAKKCDQLKKADDRNKCKKAEDQRHKKAMDKCHDEMEKCKKDCKYREGSGSGGR